MGPVKQVDIPERVEDFLSQEIEEHYLTRAGLKDAVDLADLYEKYADLASLEAVANARQQCIDLPGKRSDYFYRLLAHLYVDRLTRPALDTFNRSIARAEVNLGDARVPFYSAAVKLVIEKRRRRRIAIDDELTRVVRELTPLLEVVVAASRVGALELGYSSYHEMAEETSGLNLKELAALAEEFLTDTEDAYLDSLKWHLRKFVQVKLAGARRHDLQYLFRNCWNDSLFPREAILPSAMTVLEEMDIDAVADGRISLDTAPRARKAARAFCAPVHVPEDIRLVLNPQGGQRDFRAFFHELGHSLHFAYTSPELPFEFRRLGDRAVTETYGFIFEYLATSPAFLRNHLGFSNSADFIHLDALAKLSLVRRYFAKLLYELDLYEVRDFKGEAERYRELMNRATCVDYGGTYYVFDLDTNYHCANYLRAWMFQADLRAHLVREFSPEWFRSRAAGRYLKNLWELGQSETVEELTRRIGLSFTTDALKTELLTALSGRV